MRFNIVTIFPEFFASPLGTSLLGKAIAAGKIQVSLHNPRDFTHNKHRHLDDAPYGGGPGMIMQAMPVVEAVRSLARPGRIIYLTPSGRPLNGQLSAQLAQESDLTLICGRYEGIDSRLGDLLPIEEVSVGEAILNGGETAAMAVMESVSRFMPGFMGKTASVEEESYTNGLLEYPQFTRPEICEGLAAPSILTSGHHAHITAWRRQQALVKTLAQRPELLAKAPLDAKDAAVLAQQPRLCAGRNLAFCLVHYPVKLENGKIGASSLTNLDIHDIARISRSYGMKDFYALSPLQDQLALLQKIIAHWIQDNKTDRSRALQLVRPVASFEEMDSLAYNLNGAKPVYVAASAQWPIGKKAPRPMTPDEVLDLCRTQPVIICLGTGRGLAWPVLAKCQAQLRPLRFLNDNHLSVRSAAAIIADRILGDFN